MKCELVEFTASDQLILTGLLYNPVKTTNKIAIYIHGMGSSVLYKPHFINSIAQELNEHNIALLAFNNRGSGLVQRFKKEGSDNSVMAGMSLELIKDCTKDIDGAIKFTKSRGYDQFYCIGHSTGANKICVYNLYNPRNSFTKYVLLAGGDDTGLFYSKVGASVFNKMLKISSNKTQNGKGEEFVSEMPEVGLVSYQSLYDTIDPDGDYNTFPFFEYMNNIKLSKKSLFRHYKSIDIPSLIIYGSIDEYSFGDVPKVIEILKKETSSPENIVFEVIAGADHSFRGKERILAKKIARWLDD